MNPVPNDLSRRDALKWLAGSISIAAPIALASPNGSTPALPAYPARSSLFDPDFSVPKPACPWDKLMTSEELKTTIALADLILPKDANGPAASEVGVPDFVNEWISAPFDKHTDDAEIIRGGIGWLNTESFRRFEKRFEELVPDQQTQIADDICVVAAAKPKHHIGAVFFQHFRRLCMDGYFTHSATWKHLGYVGNATIGGPYPGVPDEIIKRLGLEDVGQ